MDWLVFSSIMPISEEANKTERKSRAILDLVKSFPTIQPVRPLYTNLFPYKRLYPAGIYKSEHMYAGQKILNFQAKRIAGINFTFSKNIRKILDSYRNKPFGVCCHLYDSIVPLARLKDRYGFRFNTVLHYSDLKMFENILSRRIFLQALDRADSISFRSASIRRLFLEKLGRNHTLNITDLLVYSGISGPPVKTGKPPLDTIRFVTAARLEKAKNIDKCLDALALLDPSLNWEFHIIGDGSLYQAIRQKIGSFPGKDRITMYGWQDHDRVLDEMAKSHIFLLPSRPETFGLVFLEAMSTGNLIIGAEHAGLHGMVTEKYAEFPATDAVAIKDAILRTMGKLHTTSPAEIRNYCLDNFSAEGASHNYYKFLECRQEQPCH
ncbi:MAG: glycosyltransferase [Spirochaetales bacterium]|nr:glycosyltransferase [Spirochaetales bacterium]